MNTLINTTTLSALALSGALLAAPLSTVLAEEGAAAQGQEAAKGEMSGMQGMQGNGGMMSPEMMEKRQEMMQKKQEMMEKKQKMMEEHMTKMETHMANIEALLRELVELNKAQ